MEWGGCSIYVFHHLISFFLLRMSIYVHSVLLTMGRKSTSDLPKFLLYEFIISACTHLARRGAHTKIKLSDLFPLHCIREKRIVFCLIFIFIYELHRPKELCSGRMGGWDGKALSTRPQNEEVHRNSIAMTRVYTAIVSIKSIAYIHRIYKSFLLIICLPLSLRHHSTQFLLLGA